MKEKVGKIKTGINAERELFDKAPNFLVAGGYKTAKLLIPNFQLGRRVRTLNQKPVKKPGINKKNKI